MLQWFLLPVWGGQRMPQSEIITYSLTGKVTPREASASKNDKNVAVVSSASVRRAERNTCIKIYKGK